ncbi:type II toxin-antitoxin system VapC family toxin [Salinarimonas chemoclinalis]|uniref:type II toxin-antitoxin system VapC family toxin n=1 Tax=Salinarimonas chemoclinalis TaxID=3241599 RepID=UPI0035561CA8
MYLVDTNVLSAPRRADRDRSVARWFERHDERTLFLSVLTLGEIERGIEAVRDRDPDFAATLRAWVDTTAALFADRILPVCPDVARIWGRLSAQIGHNGVDVVIAATALHHGAVVVTRNVAHFEGTGVEVENPFG